MGSSHFAVEGPLPHGPRHNALYPGVRKVLPVGVLQHVRFRIFVLFGRVHLRDPDRTAVRGQPVQLRAQFVRLDWAAEVGLAAEADLETGGGDPVIE
jgi:hypothetical protein